MIDYSIWENNITNTTLWNSVEPISAELNMFNFLIYYNVIKAYFWFQGWMFQDSSITYPAITQMRVVRDDNRHSV